MTGIRSRVELASDQPTPCMRYHFVFQGEVSAVVVTRSSPSHLMLAIPTQPGTISRTGKPWSGGSGSPFIPQAMSTSSSALAMGSGRRTRPWFTPPSTYGSSRPTAITCTAESSSPACRRIVPSGTPVQRATPIAPRPHWVPGRP